MKNNSFIQYYFKGKLMEKMPATIISQTDNETIVLDSSNARELRFVFEQNVWLLSGAKNSMNPLYGTMLVC